VDKSGKSLAEIASEEILEECGYAVPPDSLVRITSYLNAIGTQGSTTTLFYATVSAAQKVSEGGGLVEHGEIIHPFMLPVCDAKAFIYQDHKPMAAGLKFALLWWFDTQAASFSTSSAAAAAASPSPVVTPAL
jgi:UDP-sugar diphosphatase